MSQYKSKYKSEFTLKQHTPLIHFQAKQKGATLRATELKPKLDRFLIDKVGMLDDDSKPKDEFKFWFIGGGKEHLALDYKVNILPDTSAKGDDRSLLNYFGNQGDGKKKYPKQNNGIFNIKIFSFNSLMKSAIEKHFLEFLATHNFGTRQTKGYGSFYLDEDNSKYKDIEEILPNNTMYISCNTTNNREIQNTIKYFWLYLKSGINLNYGNGDCDKPYYAPFIREYLYEKDNPSTWDKRWLKETFFGLNPNNIQNYVFARALLGLSSKFTFKKTKEPCNKHSNELSIDRDYQIEVSHASLQRIPSPITFKPIVSTTQTKIYILLNQSLVEQTISTICKKDFDFIIKLWNGKKSLPELDRDDKNKYFVYENEYNENDTFFDTYWDLEKKGIHKIGIPKVFNLPVLNTLNLEELLNKFQNKISTSFTLQINRSDRISFSIKRIES